VVLARRQVPTRDQTRHYERMSADHWEQVHTATSVGEASWWQPADAVWVDLVDATGVATSARVADIGSGSSALVDALVGRGYTDITLLDLSGTALHRVVERVRAEFGERAAGVRALVGDVRTTVLEPPVDVWFDRAVFHFLTDPEDKAAYVLAMRAGVAPGGYAVVSTFAEDGPEECSGLPVARYDSDGLVTALDASRWTLVRSERRVHTTPAGVEQPFTTVVLRRP
jgi:SAM-dependent methyltransferase